MSGFAMTCYPASGCPASDQMHRMAVRPVVVKKQQARLISDLKS